jgi:hypothetical protein
LSETNQQSLRFLTLKDWVYVIEDVSLSIVRRKLGRVLDE